MVYSYLCRRGGLLLDVLSRVVFTADSHRARLMVARSCTQRPREEPLWDGGERWWQGGGDFLMGSGGYDDMETTRVSDIDKLREELKARSERNRAYLIVLAGADVGKTFKLNDGEVTIGRSRSADIKLDDDSISRKHVRLQLSGERVVIEDLKSSNGTLVNGERVSEAPLADGDKIRVGETTILKFTYHDQLDEHFQKQMYDAALRDPLTNIFNKKYFLDQLTTETSFARRHTAPLALILFDLDHFKKVNDTYGHVIGDEVLKFVANIVSGMLRNEDVFARYGGEEFVILLRGTAVDAAAALAERIRQAIEAAEFVFETAQLRCTVSVGVANLQAQHEGDQDLVASADRALYTAKQDGRNRVETASA